MNEILPSASDHPFEDSIPEAGAPLESILCTEELQRRPSRPPDHEKENRALVALMSALADSPSTIFQRLADTILNITECDSAGLSLLTIDGKRPDTRGTRFYWPAIAGMWNLHAGGGTPRHFGPCGDVLDQNRTLLFRHFERRYPYLLPVIPAAEECLLVPFYVGGKAVGTIWAIMHSDRRTFDAEDDRVMGSLGKVAAATYQALACIDDLKIEIVEHEKAEAEASELARGLEAQAQRQYQTVVETATDAVVTIDATSAIRLVNPAVTKVFGYEPAEVIGKPLTVLMPARLANRHLTGLQRYVETGHRRLNWSAIELIGLRKNGEEFPVEISFAEVINDGQRTFTGFIRDITERKQAEELRAARTRQVAVRADVSSALATDDTLRGTLESCAEAVVKHLGAAFARIWVVTKDGRFLELQASAGMYTHLDGAHRLVPVGHLKIGLIALERTPHVTNDVINDPRLSNPDWAGAEGMVGFAGFPLLAGGQVVGVLAMFSREPISQAVIETLASISDTIAQGIQRKQAANALLKAQSELAEMTRLTTMGELAASIAHEINQPLASVVTNAQACARLLRAQPPLWDDVMGAVSDIAEAGKRASDVIARIRLLLRKGVSEPLPLSVNDVIRDVIALTRDMTGQKRVMLDTRLTHDVPQVLADRVQLQQVLINLIANAAEAMSDVSDRPRRLTISSGCNDESQVEVAVVDAGVGIDPKHRDRVFDPFFTTKADGMGMGLAICRGIVDAHGGRLWATPNPDFGTTVRLALPAVETEDA